MENPRDHLAAVLERMTARIDELESRIATLERHSGSPDLVHQLPSAHAMAESHPLVQLSPGRSQGASSAIGRLFLGIAGGYLLRALAESGVIPQWAAVLLALTYATGWLLLTARVPADAKFAVAISSATAALIFSPMMWETTSRFKVVSNVVSSGVLAAFVVLAIVLGWRQKLTSLVWAPTFFPAITAFALLVATRDPAPFAWSLLFMVLLTEYAGLHGRWRSLRPPMALLGNFAVLVLIVVYSGQLQIPPEYTPVSSAALLVLASGLFAIYGVSVTVSSVVLKQSIGVFEIIQTVIAFVLAVVNALRITHDAAAPQIAIIAFLFAGACYFVAVTRFERAGQIWNYQIFVAWGAALVSLGILMIFPGPAIAFAILALVATACGIQFIRWSFAIQGAVFLGLAGYFSGLWEYAARALAGQLSPAPASSLWIVAPCVVICCALVWQQRHGAAPRVRSLLRLFFSFLATATLAALAVTGLVWLTSGGSSLAASNLAVIRTAVLWIAILGLSFSGTRWNHAELVWIAYATIAFCTMKLLFEDLRYGTLGSIAASLFFYGTVWVVVPRWVLRYAAGMSKRDQGMPGSEKPESGVSAERIVPPGHTSYKPLVPGQNGQYGRGAEEKDQSNTKAVGGGNA